MLDVGHFVDQRERANQSPSLRLCTARRKHLVSYDFTHRTLGMTSKTCSKYVTSLSCGDDEINDQCGAQVIQATPTFVLAISCSF